ncbi:MAG: hypothetical protein AMXMBFR66_19970 [Pseudomonadota bacterium]|nr:PepSY domain-containing protein [Rubrivivax sp.]
MQLIARTFESVVRRALLAFGAGTLLALGSAQAQTTAAASPPAASAATGAASLTIRDIYDRLEAAGYREMREIEYTQGRYEVKARNAQGQSVKLHVNARSGAVERTRVR